MERLEFCSIQPLCICCCECSLFCFGPLAKLHGFAQVDNFVLECLDLGRAHALHIVNEHVDESVVRLGRQVGPEHGPFHGVGGAVGIWAHSARLHRLVLSVEDDLLPGDKRCVVDIVATDHQHAIVIQLLNLLHSGQVCRALKILHIDEGGASLQERSVGESVAELEGCWDALAVLGVCKTSVDLLVQHLC